MYNLCCISNDLKAKKISFQTMTWKRFNQLCDEHGAQYALNELGSRWLNNVQVTRSCIKHCAKQGWGYRVSSNLFPCLTHPDFSYYVSDVPQYNQILCVFNDIAKNNAWGVRLSTHPSQFVVLASENKDAVGKSIVDLNHHGWVMDLLGCERSYENPINIHINCTKGHLDDIAHRFIANLNKCDKSVISRLVVEVEDKGCWSVENLCKHFDIPVTFDTLHHKCNNPENLPESSAMKKCASTWGKIKPLFHYSESHPDKPNPRCHADMPIDCPPDFYADWDVELKQKDFAIRECERFRKIING